jgi:hypothetical protein
MVVPEIDDSLILDCYRLAAYYHLDPRIFLDMTISELRLHRRRTYEMDRERPSGDD